MNIRDCTHPWQQVPGWFDEYEGLCLQKYVLLTPPDAQIVELGTWAGRSMVCMAEVKQGRTLTTVDTYRVSSQAASLGDVLAAQELATRLAQKWGVTMVGKDVVECGLAWKHPVGLLLVDDHHSAEHVAHVIHAWSPKMAPQSYMCFHDYLGGFGVEEGCHALGVEWTWRDRVKSLAIYQRT